MTISRAQMGQMGTMERVALAYLREHYGPGPYGADAYRVAELRAREHIAMARALRSEPPIEDAEADAALEALAQRIEGAAE